MNPFLHHELMVLIPVFWHTVVIYLFLIVMFRIVGRRQLGQLNVIDLVIIILMGSAVETAMVNANTTLQAGLLCAATLMLLNRLITFILSKSRRLRSGFAGNPVLIIKEGKFIEEHLLREGLTHEDVMEAVRERDLFNLDDVRFAILEVDGRINVIPKTAVTHHSKLLNRQSKGKATLSS